MYSHSLAGAHWRKSSHSGSQEVNCVEVAAAGAGVVVRDSKNPDGPVLSFAPSTFAAFIARTKRDPR